MRRLILPLLFILLLVPLVGCDSPTHSENEVIAIVKEDCFNCNMAKFGGRTLGALLAASSDRVVGARDWVANYRGDGEWWVGAYVTFVSDSNINVFMVEWRFYEKSGAVEVLMVR